MRLKQLRISGFKSFADTTVIEFPGAVSGIVGPNGCGKSNVIDAIRWVLGEARVSELRGSSSMSELIFAGSTNRPASSRASVEMVLDNSDGKIAGAWGRYTELSIKRIITRDGTNIYMINNQQVRRRDVQDIFMGTGLGPRSYAIISQGMISNFIRAKPEELRVYLEEAAGVSKYKERRRETETALASTRGNLEKVSLLQENKRVEIERLTGEAEIARQWQDLEDQRIEAELLWYVSQEDDAAAAVNKLNAQIAQKEALMLESRGQAQKLLVEIEGMKDEARIKREAADAARQSAWQTQSSVTELEGNIRVIIEKKDSIARQIAGNQQALQRRKEQKEQTSERIAQFQEHKEALAQEAAEYEEEAAALSESVAERQQDYEMLSAAYEQARSKSVEAQNQINVFHVEMQAVSREVSEVESRIEALRLESRPAAAPDEERFEELTEKIEENTALLEETAAQSEELSEALAQAKEQLEALRGDRQARAQELERTSARVQTLSAVQERAEGQGKLPQWLAKMGLESLPRLFEALDIDPGWAVALEAVLREKASALTVGDVRRAAGFGFDPPPSKLVFYSEAKPLPVDPIEGFEPLLSHVRTDQPRIMRALEGWLAGVYAAPDLAQAAAAAEKLGARGLFVTPQGHVVDRVSITFWAEDSEDAGIVSRAAQIRELAAKEAELRAQIEELDEKLIAAKAKAADFEVQYRAKEAFASEIRNLTHALEVEHSALEAAIEAWRQRSTRVALELRELEERLEELRVRQEEGENRFAQYDEKLARVQQAAADAQAQLEEAESALTDLEAQQRDMQAQAQVARVQLRAVDERIADARRQLETADEEIELMAASLEELAAQAETLDETAEREGLSRLLAELDEKNKAQELAQNAAQEAENALSQAYELQRRLNDDQTPMLQEISDLKVKRESWATQSRAFTEWLDQNGADRQSLREKLIAEKLKTTTLKNRVAKFAEEIAALGPVNHAALENLEASRRAMQETERQVADLEEAIGNLEATIRKIDAETRELLRTTFAAVNENFMDMFTGLFGGGSAQLKMTGDEILEAGVEVIAQPPGKKNASVKLLSGGEQALTATALVFAIFKLNPAPFCLLDEVDAPLDEANQDRLARRIVQMSANTQFMMITHHRVTMEHLGQLVGVTMKEPGVSRVVSVDVQAAADMAAS